MNFRMLLVLTRCCLGGSNFVALSFQKVGLDGRLERNTTYPVESGSVNHTLFMKCFFYNWEPQFSLSYFSESRYHVFFYLGCLSSPCLLTGTQPDHILLGGCTTLAQRPGPWSGTEPRLEALVRA